MNLRTVLLLVFALSAAAVTAYFARNWIADQRAAWESQVPAQEEAPALPVKEILVANEDLSTGTFVRPEHLRWQTWPEDGVNDGYLVKGEASEQDLEGAVVRTHLFAGEPITKSRVVHPGERGFLAAVLEVGQRAVSVPVDATSGIAGFVFPGDAVDVILTFNVTVKDQESEENQKRYFSETLLHDIRVLAIDQAVENADGSAKVAKTATLEVTSKDAEKIAIALEIGTLSLSLQSLAREDQTVDGQTVDGTLQPASLVNGGAEPKPEATPETKESYTRDIDVLYMIGDPYGLFLPGGAGQAIDVLHGSEAEQVKF
jgi:pilus assembly protein CpaB